MHGDAAKRSKRYNGSAAGVKNVVRGCCKIARDQDRCRIGMMTDDQDVFRPLLDWLNPDREEAAARLTALRRRLIWFFRRRGQSRDAEDLAHDVLLTMANKCADGAADAYQVPEQLMVGIAWNVLRRKVAVSEPAADDVAAVDSIPVVFPRPEFADSPDKRCRDRVLAALPTADKRLLVEYVAGDERERAEMANRLGISRETLRVRIHRMKRTLLEKVHDCVKTSRQFV
jgi:DNA-directed RNA polymerase specialized sigma24 family protein